MSSDKLMICPDGHRCENGSVCTENPQDEGAFYCDCDEANLNDIYVGLYCEHKATSYCTLGQEMSSVSFCTNKGSCKVNVSPDAAHMGCDCKTGYTGDHCEFVEGSTQPQGWPFDGSEQQDSYRAPKNDTALQTGVVVVIVLVVLATMAAVAYLIVKKKKQQQHGVPHANKSVLDASDLQLEADGGVLKDSVQAGGGSEHTSGPAVMEEGDDSNIDMQDVRLEGGASELI